MTLAQNRPTSTPTNTPLPALTAARPVERDADAPGGRLALSGGLIATAIIGLAAYAIARKRGR